MDDVTAGRALLKTTKGGKAVSTWFTQTSEGYWTNIRWGQRSLAPNGEKAWFFSTPEKLKDFYDAVAQHIDVLDPVLKRAMEKGPMQVEQQAV